MHLNITLCLLIFIYVYLSINLSYIHRNKLLINIHTIIDYVNLNNYLFIILANSLIENKRI